MFQQYPWDQQQPQKFLLVRTVDASFEIPENSQVEEPAVEISLVYMGCFRIIQTVGLNRRPNRPNLSRNQAPPDS